MKKKQRIDQAVVLLVEYFNKYGTVPVGFEYVLDQMASDPVTFLRFQHRLCEKSPNTVTALLSCMRPEGNGFLIQCSSDFREYQ